MNLKEKHYVGVDCHKDTIACYINGRFKEFKTDFKGFTKALEWVKKIEPNCAWAIEGTGRVQFFAPKIIKISVLSSQTDCSFVFT